MTIDDSQGMEEVKGEESLISYEDDEMNTLNSIHRVPLAAAIYLFASRRFYKKEAHKKLINRMHTMKLINQTEAVDLVETYLQILSGKKYPNFHPNVGILTVVGLASTQIYSKDIGCMLSKNDNDDRRYEGLSSTQNHQSGLSKLFNNHGYEWLITNTKAHKTIGPIGVIKINETTASFLNGPPRRRFPNPTGDNLEYSQVYDLVRQFLLDGVKTNIPFTESGVIIGLGKSSFLPFHQEYSESSKNSKNVPQGQEYHFNLPCSFIGADIGVIDADKDRSKRFDFIPLQDIKRTYLPHDKAIELTARYLQVFYTILSDSQSINSSAREKSRAVMYSHTGSLYTWSPNNTKWVYSLPSSICRDIANTTMNSLSSTSTLKTGQLGSTQTSQQSTTTSNTANLSLVPPPVKGTHGTVGTGLFKHSLGQSLGQSTPSERSGTSGASKAIAAARAVFRVGSPVSVKPTVITATATSPLPHPLPLPLPTSPLSMTAAVTTSYGSTILRPIARTAALGVSTAALGVSTGLATISAATAAAATGLDNMRYTRSPKIMMDEMAADSNGFQRILSGYESMSKLKGTDSYSRSNDFNSSDPFQTDIAYGLHLLSLSLDDKTGWQEAAMMALKETVVGGGWIFLKRHSMTIFFSHRYMDEHDCMLVADKLQVREVLMMARVS